jgi:hypothetical protein
VTPLTEQEWLRLASLTLAEAEEPNSPVLGRHRRMARALWPAVAPLAEDVRRLREALKELHDAISYDMGASPVESERLWDAVHAARTALSGERP